MYYSMTHNAYRLGVRMGARRNFLRGDKSKKGHHLRRKMPLHGEKGPHKEKKGHQFGEEAPYKENPPPHDKKLFLDFPRGAGA